MHGVNAFPYGIQPMMQLNIVADLPLINRQAAHMMLNGAISGDNTESMEPETTHPRCAFFAIAWHFAFAIVD